MKRLSHAKKTKAGEEDGTQRSNIKSNASLFGKLCIGSQARGGDSTVRLHPITDHSRHRYQHLEKLVQNQICCPVLMFPVKAKLLHLWFGWTCNKVHVDPHRLHNVPGIRRASIHTIRQVELHSTSMYLIAWNTYFDNSLKQAVMVKSRYGVRVKGQANVPKNRSELQRY